MNIQKIKLFVNDNWEAQELGKRLEMLFEREGFLLTSANDFDLGVAVGGDGAFLRMINDSNFLEDVFYVGVNAGTLGFAQDVEIHEVEDFIYHLKSGEYFFEEIGVETIQVFSNNQEEVFHALNEVVIRDQELKTTHFDLMIDRVFLERYVGDGILVSTSFGSTAYNLSLGGSMVYNEFDTLQITPVAPIHNSSYPTLTNSIILPAEKTIQLFPRSSHKFLLTIDGRNHMYYDVTSIKLSIDKHIRLIRKKDYNYIQKINDKFIQ